MKNKMRGALAVLLLALPLQATALCTPSCSCLASTTAVSFGVYNPHSASPLDSTGNVRVTCVGTPDLLVSYQIALSNGLNSSNFSPRKMASGANLLNYNLYADSSHASIWGDGSGGTQTVSGSITIMPGDTSRDHPVFGRIPGSQTTVPPGSYSDTVLVTVTYQ